LSSSFPISDAVPPELTRIAGLADLTEADFHHVEDGKSPIMTEEELNNRLPIIPHRAVTDTDCPGCLVAGLRNSTGEVLCNECGTLIGSMFVTEVEAFFQNLYKGSR
jgi:hypothetical protein